MSLALSINLNQSGLNLDEVWLRVKNRRGLMAVLAREGVNQFRANFRQLAGKGNKFDAPSTHYWINAARATSSAVLSESSAIIAVNQVGVRLHLLGGEVKPILKQWLTVPAIAAAHGKRATEIPGLFVVHKKGGPPFALARKTSAGKLEVVFWLKKSVKHRPDPTVIPSGATLADALRRRGGEYLKSEMFRNN